MAITTTVHDILANVGGFTGEGSEQKKIDYLREHDSATLRLLLQQAFDPNIEYNLPKDDPEYRPSTKAVGITEANLFSETRRLKSVWLKTPEEIKTSHMSSLEREAHAETALEVLHTQLREANAIILELQTKVELKRAEVKALIAKIHEMTQFRGVAANANQRLQYLFVQLLESLPADDAKLLLAVKNKTLAQKYKIPKALVKKAFPDLLAD